MWLAVLFASLLHSSAAAPSSLFRRKVVFVSYADTAYTSSLHRLTSEAIATGQFTHVFGFTRANISTAFAQKNAAILNEPRGGGYWLWKPYFVNVVLSRLQYGDILMYADAGCEFVASPKQYIDLASRYGFLGFRLPFLTKHFTKGDLFAAMNMDADTYGDERQHVGGIFLMQKSETTETVAREWLHYAQQKHLIDDSPSVVPNDPAFDEHRHDQAIFSLLIYKHGLQLVLEDQTDPRYKVGRLKVIFAARGKHKDLGRVKTEATASGFVGAVGGVHIDNH